VTDATEDQTYTYDVNATDPDVGDVLTYSLTQKPGFLSINPNNGVISGTPDNGDVGDHAVTVVVTEARYATDTQSYTLSVANVNDAPTITSTPVTDADEDAAYSYDVNATDPDVGDVLTYSLTQKPDFLSINPNNGVISGTPDNGDVGDHAVTVVVTDASNATDTQSYTLSVANANDAPIITSTPVTNATEDVAPRILIS
jgi:hypothetical protein